MFFFFNDTATTEIYTLSLHDALPICAYRAHPLLRRRYRHHREWDPTRRTRGLAGRRDRKSTRLNSSHLVISYAVFCLKKKKKNITIYTTSNLAPTNTHQVALRAIVIT